MSLPRPSRLAAAGWALAAIVYQLPVAVARPGAGLDPSWVLGLHLAAGERLQWGRDVMWTYGPLGFADSADYFDQATWLGGWLLTLGVHVLFVAVLAAFLLRVAAPWWAWVAVAAAWSLPLTGLPSVEYQAQVAAALLLALAARAAGRESAALAAAGGALLGLLFLVKGTGLAGAAGLLLVFALWMTLAERRPRAPAVALAAFAVTFAILWLAAGQSPAGVPGYLRSIYEMVSGYTPAMSVLREYPVRHTTAQVVLAAALLTLLAAVFAAGLAGGRRTLALTALMLSPVLFLAYKEGFTRFGDRQLVFFSVATIVFALLPAVLRTDSSEPAPRPGRRLAGAALGALLAAAALTTGALVGGGAAATGAVHLPAVWPAVTLAARLGTYAEAGRLLADPAERTAYRAATVEAMRAVYGLPEAGLGPERGNTTDVLPWDIDLAYAYGIRWHPRPVLASYSAYTPYLDGADAAYLAGASAPDRILIASASIDGRYAAFDEPATLRVLESRYQVVGTVGAFVRLERRPEGRVPPLRPLEGDRTAALGGWVTVPEGNDGNVYGEIRVPYSLRGRAANLLFQPSALRIQLRLDDGTVTQPYRFVPAVAADGVDLSSLATDRQSLARLLAGDKDRPIRAFRITADRPADYAGGVGVRFLTTG